MCTYLNKTGSSYYFRRPVPDDLRGYFLTDRGNARTEWKRALGTKDREEAKRLLRPHATETDNLIDDARRALRIAPPMSSAEQAEQAREREELAAEAALLAESQQRREARTELRTLWRKRRATSTAMLTPEQAAAVDLIKERDAELEQLRQAVATMKADKYGPSYQADSGALSTGTQSPAVSLNALFERYAQAGSAKPRTISKWRGYVANLVEHLGHDDAAKVTRGDLNRWSAALVAKGLAKKTVADGYLTAAKVTLSIAHDDELITTNPASGLTVRAPKAVKLRERDLTDEEALTILRGSLLPPPPKLSKEHALARRWVPWLCAYTGARIAEMTQLRAGDIRQEQGIWVVHLTPDAGSIKDSTARRVPLHPHLIEQGILKLAKKDDWTPLFHRVGVGSDDNPAAQMRASDLAGWVRSLGVNDPNVQPNHGWRHRFKTQSRIVGMPEQLADRIQGHVPAHQGGKYGGVLPVATLLAAIEGMPRYEVEGVPVTAAGGEDAV